MSIIYAFVKIFNKMEYAESFLRGKLYLNTLRYYKNYCDEVGESRGDLYEGAVAIFQPNLIGEVRIGSIEIKGSDISSPIVISDNEELSKHAFCIYSLNSSGMDQISRESLDDFKEMIQIHHSNYGLGNICVVITRAQQFIDRCKQALQKMNFEATLAPVNYYNDSSIHGKIPGSHHGYQKRVKFIKQREYRILLKANPATNDSLTLDIGDISDIALISETEKFNDLLKLDLPCSD